MKIAILDDGIVASFPNCDSYAVSDGRIIPCDSMVSKKSHGTYCARIITKEIKNYQISSISIYHEDERGNSSQLEKALDWCIGKGFDVINISCGYTEFFSNEYINSLCFQLRKEGTYLFASYSNMGCYTLPAALPYVFGCSECKWKSMPGFLSHSDVFIDGDVTISDQFGTERLVNCNSFACAEAVHQFIVCGSENFSRRFVEKKIALYDFSFLKNAVMWSELDSKSFASYADEVSIIVRSNEIADFSVNDCIKKIRQVFCIVFLSSCVPHRILYECAQYGIRIWDETMLNILNAQSEEKADIPVPIIACNHRKWKTIMDELSSLFEEEGYSVLKCSDSFEDMFAGFWKVNSVAQMDSLYDELNPSVILVHNISMNSFEPDVEIEDSSDGNCFCRIHFENRAENCFDMRSLFHRICSFYIEQ